MSPPFVIVQVSPRLGDSAAILVEEEEEEEEEGWGGNTQMRVG